MYLNFANKVIGHPSNVNYSQESYDIDTLGESLEDLHSSLEHAQDLQHLVSGHSIKTPLEKKLIQRELNKISQGQLGVSLESFGEINVSLEFIGTVVTKIWEGIKWVFKKLGELIFGISSGKSNEDREHAIEIIDTTERDNKKKEELFKFMLKQKNTLKWFDKNALKNVEINNGYRFFEAFNHVTYNTLVLIKKSYEISKDIEDGFKHLDDIAENFKKKIDSKNEIDVFFDRIFEIADISKDYIKEKDYYKCYFFGKNLFIYFDEESKKKKKAELVKILNTFEDIDHENEDADLIADFNYLFARKTWSADIAWENPNTFTSEEIDKIDFTYKENTAYKPETWEIERLGEVFELVGKYNKSIVLSVEKINKTIDVIIQKDTTENSDKNKKFAARMAQFYSKNLSKFLGSGYTSILTKTKEIWTTIAKFKVPELDK